MESKSRDTKAELLHIMETVCPSPDSKWVARAKRYFCAAPAASMAEPSKALTLNRKEFYATSGKRIPAK